MTAAAPARLIALVAALAMALALMATPARAQTQEGLVNVIVQDVYIQVPVAVAANVCDVNVNILAEQIRHGGARCEADADSDAVIGIGEDGELPPVQSGLVNVLIRDVALQIPIGIAANVCDVNANVLARQQRHGGARCDAQALPVADLDLA
jgi:hypothetical protein